VQGNSTGPAAVPSGTELRRLTAVLEALPAAAVLVDEHGRVVTANRAWLGGPAREAGTGLGEDYLAGLAATLEPADAATVTAGLRRLLGARRGREPGFAHGCRRRGPGAVRGVHLRATRVEDPPGVVVTHTDSPVAGPGADQALAWLARHDELTGLANRSTMLELIGGALAEQAADGPGTALLLLDLDGFKTLNDSLGHQVGDALLCEAAGRLAEEVRPGDAVGRLGGDQFVVLARGCDAAEAAALAFRLQTTFALPFPAAGLSVPLSASIGVAVGRPGSTDAHALLSDADAAMYAAKAAGRDRVHLFSPELREAARWRLDVATRLRGSPVDQLVVHYQPVVRVDTGEVEGVEALLRWQHPERGLLMPDAFLGVAEETGQLIPITRWLLHETTRQAAAWAAQGLRLRMAVNISARHFSTETLVRDVRSALRGSGMPPE
jgi:diguanylate cyclase (GGDEF)-like protein